MLSAGGKARLLAGALAAAMGALVACEEGDAVFNPLEDTTPPVVSITSAVPSGDTLRVTVQAEDFINVAFVVTEIRSLDQLTTEVTPSGDTLILGRLIGIDTTRFSSRNTSVTVNTTFLTFFTQPTAVQIRAIAEDDQQNRGTDEATIVAGGGGGAGGPLGGPSVAITSPIGGQTVRENTLIRVGVQVSDPTGLQQLNVVLTGATTAADTIRFATFRTDIDTLLDFFVPPGAAGATPPTPLNIFAEAINLNTISAFSQIIVQVADQIANDSIAPIVSMLVTGGVQRRANEPPRMEVDDSLLVDVVAIDQETAITRVGVTLVVTNSRVGGTVTTTIFEDNLFSPAISGSVPITFVITPEDPRLATVFTAADVPDTLFFEVTAWAFDGATVANCGATVDPLGTSNSLACDATDPVQASGISGGFLERMVVGGRTVGFPQGSLIADAVVDTLRELLLLSDWEFGIVRPFDLRNEQFVSNIPVGSEPWGLAIDNSQDALLVANSGGTNISLVGLGPRTPGAPAIVGEIDRFQTQDIQVYRVRLAVDPLGFPVFPVESFDFSDRPQFVAQAANGLILFSTRPAVEDNQPGTIREFDSVLREIRFFVDYAVRDPVIARGIQIINADSVFAVDGGERFKVCDHSRLNKALASCIFANDSLGDARLQIDVKKITDNWDTEVLSDLVINSVGLQDTTFVTASGDRQFVAFGEGDTPGGLPVVPGRIIIYRSASRTITNVLQVTDLTGNAAERVLGLALNNDGSLGVGRGEVAFYFDPTLRLLGTNNDINPSGVGAALHPDHSAASFTDPNTRLSFLGSGDAKVEIVDTRFFSFKRGEVLIRDPIVGPLVATRRLVSDPIDTAVKLYGVTADGVVVIRVKNSDIDPMP